MILVMDNTNTVSSFSVEQLARAASIIADTTIFFMFFIGLSLFSLFHLGRAAARSPFGDRSRQIQRLLLEGQSDGVGLALDEIRIVVDGGRHTVERRSRSFDTQRNRIARDRPDHDGLADDGGRRGDHLVRRNAGDIQRRSRSIGYGIGSQIEARRKFRIQHGDLLDRRSAGQRSTLPVLSFFEPLIGSASSTSTVPSGLANATLPSAGCPAGYHAFI